MIVAKNKHLKKEFEIVIEKEQSLERDEIESA